MGLLNTAIDTLVGHEEPPHDGYDVYPYPTENPFKNERDQWKRDPFYRVGFVAGFFTKQFREDPVGTVKRSAKAALWS